MQINWHGDLSDDCHAEHNGMVAHCECMGDFEADIENENGERSTLEIWFADVRRGDEYIFSTNDHAGIITSGEMARAVCEAIMKGQSDVE